MQTFFFYSEQVSVFVIFYCQSGFDISDIDICDLTAITITH